MGWIFLQDVLVLLAGALALGALCQRLRQSSLVGYLLAGMLLGPNALGWVSGASNNVDVLAELGIALLLFTIGLEFSWRRFRHLGRPALVGGLLQVGVTLIIASLIALLVGADGPAAIAIGAMIALSSTAGVLGTLVQRSELDSVYGRRALGLLLFQDIAVVPLVLLVGLLGHTGTVSEMLWDTGRTITLAILLGTGFVVLFNYIVPLLLGTRLVSRNRELPILLAVVTVIGSAWAAHEAGLSAALGAFVAGMLLGNSPFAAQIRADVSSLRTLLVTLFFGTVGMLADPEFIQAHWAALLGLVAAIIIGKTLIIWGILRLLGQRHTHAFAIGLSLAQVGEFSFVIAGIAMAESVIDAGHRELMVSATIMTLILTPYLVSVARPLGRRVEQLMRGKATASETEDDKAAAPEPILMIIGFGPAGQGVAKGLSQAKCAVHVVDLNPRITAAAQKFGLIGHVGDATQPDVLDHAGIAGAQIVAITLPDPKATVRVTQYVRRAAPNAWIISRARYSVYLSELERAGADCVIDEEEQVGRRICVEVRKSLRKREGGGDPVEDALGDDPEPIVEEPLGSAAADQAR